MLSLARPFPAIPAQPAVVPPPAAAVVHVAGGAPFSVSEVSIETPGEGEGPPSVECTSLRRRGDSNPSGGCVSYRGRSLLGGLAVAGLVVLLCLLVGVVVGANRQLSALSGRLDALEGAAAPAEVAAAPVGGTICVACDFGVMVNSFGFQYNQFASSKKDYNFIYMYCVNLIDGGILVASCKTVQVCCAPVLDGPTPNFAIWCFGPVFCGAATG